MKQEVLVLQEVFKQLEISKVNYEDLKPSDKQ